MASKQKKNIPAKKKQISLLQPTITLLGQSEDGETRGEIFAFYRTESGKLEGFPLLGIGMLSELEGFTLSNNSKKFRLLCEFVNGIFGVLLRGADTDKDAQEHIEAIRRMIFAKELQIGKTKIAEVLKFRTIPQAKAHAWLWFNLIMRLGPVLEPSHPTKVFAGDRMKLRDNLPTDHGLVKVAHEHFVKGKVNTAQSLAYRIYKSLMTENGIKMPNSKDIKTELNDFLRFKDVREADATGYIQQLKIEGFDFNFIMGGKGLDRTLG
jgi:hypothetical protein